MKKKNPLLLLVGNKIAFHSGNFAGHNAIITNVDWESKDPRAVRGYLHTATLDDGRTIYIEKFEHWDYA